MAAAYTFFIGTRVPMLETVAAIVHRQVLQTVAEETTRLALERNGLLAPERLNICVAPINGDPKAIHNALANLLCGPAPKTRSLRGARICPLGKHKLALMLADDAFKAWAVAAVAELRLLGFQVASAPAPHCSLVKITYNEKGKKAKREASALAAQAKLHEHENPGIDIEMLIGETLDCSVQLLAIGTHELACE
jgi:hypothetical protein